MVKKLTIKKLVNGSSINKWLILCQFLVDFLDKGIDIIKALLSNIAFSNLKRKERANISKPA
jgi:hypothetical protein